MAELLPEKKESLLGEKICQSAWPYAVNKAAPGFRHQIMESAEDMGLSRYMGDSVVLAVRDVLEKKEGDK